MGKFTIQIAKKGVISSAIQVEIPDGDIKLTYLIPWLYQLFDKIIESELYDKTDISCSKGCGICCNQLVPLTIPEVFFLNDLVKSFSHKKLVKINHRFSKTIELIQNAGLLEELRNPRKNSDIDIAYFHLKTACPFLEDGICSIYQSRPFICREYYVTSDTKYCSNLEMDKIQKIKITRNIGALIAALAARLHGLQPVPIPLILIPLWIKEHADFETKKWPGIWLFHKIIDCLTGLNDDDFNLNPASNLKNPPE
jgi:Fe-S-cluster containining protein